MASNFTDYGAIKLSPPEFQERSKEKERIWPVALCSFIACLSSLICGLMLSFSSPTLTELSKENPNRMILANQTYGSLFASFGTVGAAVGSLTAWPLSEIFGRKAVLMVAGFPAFCGWLLIVFSAYIVDNLKAFVATLLIGRLLTGGAAGISAGATAVYIGEVASKKWRGFFGNWNMLFVTIGMLFGYSLGTLNPVWDSYKYYHSALIAAAIVLPFEFLMLLPTTAESPRWLYFNEKMEKNGEGKYLKTLKYLRGRHAGTLIDEEVEDIRVSAATSNVPLRKILASLKYFRVLWPFFLVVMLMFFQQFSGINAILFFSASIFEQANFNALDSNLATLGAVGAVQFIGTLISVFLIERLGRKTLLVSSSVGMLVSCVLLGVYFYILDDVCDSCLGSNCHSSSAPMCSNPNIGWLAIVSMVIFIGAFSIGWGPIPWTMLSELLPDSVRTLAGSVAALSNWLCAILITSCFELYVSALTPKIAWWSFAVVMFVSVFVVILILPETRGLSFHEIQEQFERKKVLAVSCSRRSKTHISLN